MDGAATGPDRGRGGRRHHPRFGEGGPEPAGPGRAHRDRELHGRPRAQGGGTGRALGAYVLDWARAAGFHGMQFNAVVETNTVAVRLWQAIGFEILGTVPEAFDSRAHGRVGLHVMYRRL